MVSKTLHRKLKAQHEPTKTEGENQKGQQCNKIPSMIDKKRILHSMVDKILHRKVKAQHEPYYKQKVKTSEEKNTKTLMLINVSVIYMNLI